MASDLPVAERGPDGAPTIVFLHGAAVSGWIWKPVVDLLADYHCLVPDLPEHGRSRELGPFTMEGAAAAVADLVEARAHGATAHVVGNSLGAQVALALLAETPELASSAILAGCTISRPGAPRRIGPVRLGGVRRPAAVEAAARARAAAPVRRDGRRPEDWLYRVLGLSAAFRMPHDVWACRVRTLVAAGEHDRGAAQRSADLLACTLPRAERRLVLGVGANWPLVSPELFAATVRAWIEDDPLPTRLLASHERRRRPSDTGPLPIAV